MTLGLIKTQWTNSSRRGFKNHHKLKKNWHFNWRNLDKLSRLTFFRKLVFSWKGLWTTERTEGERRIWILVKGSLTQGMWEWRCSGSISGASWCFNSCRIPLFGNLPNLHHFSSKPLKGQSPQGSLMTFHRIFYRPFKGPQVYFRYIYDLCLTLWLNNT